MQIYNRKGTEILNSKSEFNHPPTARVVVEKKKKYETKANQAGVDNKNGNNNWTNYPFFLVVKMAYPTDVMAETSEQQWSGLMVESTLLDFYNCVPNFCAI